MRFTSSESITLSTSQVSRKQSAKDDLNGIGSQNIAGSGAGNWYPLEREIRNGREYADIVDSQAKLLDDPVVTEFINRLGQNLVRNSDAKVPFTTNVRDRAGLLGYLRY